MADAAAANDRQVFVDTFARFSPTKQLLRDASAEETYGRLQVLEMEGHTALLWPGYDLRLDTIVLDAVATGGQAGTSTSIENYLGFPAGISGAELTDRAVIQTKKFGARIIVPAGAIALERETYCYVVRVEGEEVVRAKAVVVESFGLAGYGYHARDEYIDASSIVPRLYLMTRMLTELGKRK